MDSIKKGYCSVEDCDKKLLCRGVCSTHYKRLIRNGTTKLACKVEGCEVRNHAKGYCKIHYLRINRTDRPDRVYGNHGLSNTKEYKAWCSIKQRCLNPNNEAYADYGGRGISIAKEWIKNFQAFYKYIGKSPSPDHSVDRIDVNGNYEPGNIVWAVDGTQVHNQRIRNTNTSGYTGVHWRKDSKKWAAAIAFEGKSYHLGLFQSAKHASEVYKTEAKRLYGQHEFMLSPEFKNKELEKERLEKQQIKKILNNISKGSSSNACWEWTGTIAKNGYGQVYYIDRTQMAHRAIYQILIGEIPGDMQLNHDCHSRDKNCFGGYSCPHRRCVNPDHMSIVTPLENLTLDDTISGRNAKQTHCLRGHKYTPANTRIAYSNGGRVRFCKTCEKIRNDRTFDKRQQEIQLGLFTVATSESLIGQTCSKGHIYDGTNTLITKRGHVQCRDCSRERSTVKNARVKAARLTAGGLDRSGPRPKTHCKQGHALNDSNLFVEKSTNRRKCRICMARIARDRRAKSKTN